MALKQDRPEVVRNLLERGFDPNTPTADGLDALYVALRDGSLKSAQVLIAWPKTNVDTRSPKDETPLMIACLRGQSEIARELLARGADVNKTGWTPLHYAATGGHVDLMQLLLDDSAYIDAASPNGTTPLMMAAKYGTEQAAQFLLDAGADPTLKNQLGMSAADFANSAGRQELAQRLVKAADAFAKRYRKPADSHR
ncbi:MAG TPA: ankyrin repeat domain-containing protein [Ramlibacter sp.]